VAGRYLPTVCVGKGKVDWKGADEFRDKLDGLLKGTEERNASRYPHCRIYDGNFVFLLKPDRLRYWLRSVALRDADETLSDCEPKGSEVKAHARELFRNVGPVRQIRKGRASASHLTT